MVTICRLLPTSLALFFVASFLSPEEVFAWGPATHLNLGLTLFEHLALLPEAMQHLLRAHQNQYLYGCISADIVVGKKFIDYRYHCHNWQVGMELLAKASNDALRAFMWGYLSHLAADTIAHNLYVPIKKLEACATPRRGHLYWEVIFDHHQSDQRILEMFYSLAQNPFTEQDEFLQQHLKPTLFSFKTNKKIFNGLLILQRLKQWQEILRQQRQRNRAALSADEIDGYYQLSFRAITSLLIDRQESQYFKQDPTGQHALQQATQMAKELRLQKASQELVQQAQSVIKESFETRLTAH